MIYECKEHGVRGNMKDEGRKKVKIEIEVND